MPALPKAIEDLAEKFRLFSGIGMRSSQKLALDVLQMQEEDFSIWLENLSTIRQKVRFCDNCGFFAQVNGNNSESALCEICLDDTRNPSQICLVEKPTDVITVEKSEVYRGYYHVLQKMISPLDNVFVEDTTISALINERLPKVLEQISNHPRKNLNKVNHQNNVEIVLFFKSGFSTEATTAYLKQTINQKDWRDKVYLTKLAQGLPLFYNPDTLDQATMAKALEDRREIPT